MRAADFVRRNGTVAYWGLLSAMGAALAILGAHPVKFGGLVVAAFAVRRFGLTLVPLYLGMVLFLPEAGGPFPAILTLTDVLFWPLILHAVLSRDALVLRSRVRLAALALATASAAALIVGVVVRDAAFKPALFNVYQQTAHLAGGLLALEAIRERADAAPLFNGMTLGGCLAAALGLAQIIGGETVVAVQQGIAESIGYPAYPVAHVERYLWWGMHKAYAGFYSPNALGGALMFCLLLAVGRQLRASSLPLLGSSILLGAGLVATFSRGAILAAVVSLALLAWRSFRRGRPAAATTLAASAILIPALYGVVVYGLTERTPIAAAIEGGGTIEVARSLKRRSAEMKLEEMRNLLSMWRRGIGLFGAGFGVLYEPDEGFVDAPHGVEVSPAYVEIVYRSGILGVMALLTAALTLRRVWHARGIMGPNGHPVQPALLGALVHSAIDHPFLTVPGLVTILWAGWGILEGSED